MAAYLPNQFERSDVAGQLVADIPGAGPLGEHGLGSRIISSDKKHPNRDLQRWRAGENQTVARE